MGRRVVEGGVDPDMLIGPTVYEVQILTNQVAIMGALAVLMPDKGAEEVLETMRASAVNTQMLLTAEPPEEETT